MPSLKETPINASFFPGLGAEDERHEEVGIAEKALRTGVRDLGDDELHNGQSTRRSSMTAVEKVSSRAHEAD